MSIAGLLSVGYLTDQTASAGGLLLSILSIFGAFAVTALALGLLRLAGAEPMPNIVQQVLDQSPRAVLLTDATGEVVMANAAYRTLVDGTEDSVTLQGRTRM